MAYTQHHPRWFSHDWFELHPRLRTELARHAIALNVVAFLLMVALLLGLFGWAQILPEQISATVDSSHRIALSEPENTYSAIINLRDQFLTQKNTAAVAELPDQF